MEWMDLHKTYEKSMEKKKTSLKVTLNWSMAMETNACLLKNQYLHNLPELTYHPLPKHCLYESDFPFSKVGYVSSLEGMCCLEIWVHVQLCIGESIYSHFETTHPDSTLPNVVFLWRCWCFEAFLLPELSSHILCTETLFDLIWRWL